MKVQVYSVSNVGKVRKNNEDAYFISHINLVDKDRGDDIKILAVLDGMGGIAKGEEASYIAEREYLKSLYASFLGKNSLEGSSNNSKDKDNFIDFNVETIVFGKESEERFLLNGNINKTEDNIPEHDIKYITNLYLSELGIDNIGAKNKYYKETLIPIVDKAIEICNSSVIQFGEDKITSPGTTLTGGIFFNDRLFITNIGDSRAYRYREETLHDDRKKKIFLNRLSKDHSYVQQLIDDKVITPQEAMRHPQKNIVTKCLGAGRYDNPDYYIYTMKKGDIYLFSTDGLHDLVSDNEIVDIIESNNDDIEKIGNELVDIALDKGGHDNITTILAKTY